MEYKTKKCKICKKKIKVYNSLQNKCFECSRDSYTPPNKVGRKTKEYTQWLNTTAKPYLLRKFGKKCSKCGAEDNLEIHHLKKRSSHPELVMSLYNITYLCVECHAKEHDGISRK